MNAVKRPESASSAGDRPKVSLCVPTFNRASLLPDCISSLLSQTLDSSEVIVVDNASTDDTVGVAGRFRANPKFRFVRNDENIGPQENWNRCVELARGEYIAICHDDDFYDPGFASYCAAFLDAYPNVGFVHCAYHVTDTAGTRIGGYQAYATDRVMPAAETFVQFLWDSHNVAFSSVMARSHAYAEAGPFRNGLICGDYDMWLRMAFRFDVGYVSAPLVYYRTHERSMSREVPLRQWYDEHVQIIDSALAMATTTMPTLEQSRAAIIDRARKLWARRGLREALSRASYGNVDGARRYLDVVESLAATTADRISARLARMLVSPVGAWLLGALRPAVHRVRRQTGQSTLPMTR